MTTSTPSSSQGPGEQGSDELWEDEIPSGDNSFLRIGPAIPITRGREEED